MERKYKLMLVDDEPWALTGIEEIIDWEAEGFTVVARCGCGRDGILAAQIHHPDAVVTDIRMPDMSGLEMIRQIREIPVPAECVIVSAYSDFEVAREAIRLSAVHYLLKPLNERDVREAASLLRAKLARTRRPVQKKAPVLLIDEKNPAFPSTRGEGAEPSFLILSDSPAVFSLQNTIKGYCQPIRFGTFAGILTTEKCTSLPPDTGESRPEPDFSDSWRLIRYGLRLPGRRVPVRAGTGRRESRENTRQRRRYPVLPLGAYGGGPGPQTAGRAVLPERDLHLRPF